jgi:hypothetical protein
MLFEDSLNERRSAEFEKEDLIENKEDTEKITKTRATQDKSKYSKLICPFLNFILCKKLRSLKHQIDFACFSEDPARLF